MGPIAVVARVVCVWLSLTAGAQSLLQIKDQYGNETTIGAPSNQWTFLVYGDRVGGEYNQKWGTGLKARSGTLPRARIVFAANLRSVPFFLKGMVTKKFLGDTARGKKKGPILLDWQGQIEKAFGHTPSVSNVYAFDPAGEMRAKDAGKGSKEDVDRFAGVVNRLAGRTE